MASDLHDHLVSTIGNTPLVKLRIDKSHKGVYYAKLESFNPGGSSKDRIGTSIIDEGEKNGDLIPGGTIIEATSGNTGLGLALIAIQRGYEIILVMPDKMSPEKMNLLKALGCKIVICPTEVEPDDPRSYYSVSQRLVEQTENSFYANQYHNPSNPEAHYKSTGPELWRQTDGKITHFICGVGTGGTISGVARYLKEKNENIKIIGVDPEGSILAYYHKNRNMNIEAKGYQVEGVGEDIIPTNVHFDLIDDFVTVNDLESFEWTRKLAKENAMLVGGSSGLAMCGLVKSMDNIDSENTFAVVLLPDTGERYLGKVFSDQWLRANKFMTPPSTLSELLESKSAHLIPLISIDANQTIGAAIDKISRFGVNQILIRSGDFYKMVEKSRLYGWVLDGKNVESRITNLEFKELPILPFDSSMSHVFKILKAEGYCCVQKNNEIMGFLSKEDLIRNFPLDYLKKFV